MKKIKFMIVSFILILSTLTPVTVQASKINMEGKTWLFIGDSYTSERETNTVTDLVAQYLGIKPNKYVKEAKIGFGFANVYNHNDRIKRYGNSKTVKNIVIVQGFFNDRYRKKAKVKAAFDKFVKTLKKKYPNAKIFFCQPHWSYLNGVYKNGKYTNKNYRKTKADRLPLYKEVCKENGVVFLNSMTNIMHNRPLDNYYLDGRHPQDKGRIHIAKKLAQALKGQYKK